MTLLRGTAANLITIGTAVASALLVTIACTRAWEPAVYGEYAYLSQTATTLALLGASALPALAVRLVAGALAANQSGKARRLAGRLIAWTAVCAALCAIAFAVVARSTTWFAPGAARVPVLLLALVMATTTVLTLATQGAGRFDRVARLTLPATGGSALMAAFLAHRGYGPDVVLLTLAAGQTLLAAGLALRLPRDLPRGADSGGPPFAEVRGYTLATAALVVVDLIVWQKSEVFFLGRLRPSEEVALYAAAYAVASAIARNAPMALGNVLTPAFAGLSGRDAKGEAEALFARAAAMMTALSAGLALIGMALAPSLLGLLRPSYLAALPLLPLLLFGLCAGNISGTASTVFHGFGRADALLKMGVVLALANLTLDVALIGRHGAPGAALACALAQGLSIPLAAILLRRTIGFSFPWTAIARIAGATAAGAAILLMVRWQLPAPDLTSDLAAAAGALAAAALVWIALGGPHDLRPRALVSDPPPPGGATPEVTVIVPTKNRPDFLDRCLRQVLEQDGPSREIVVIDSSDDERSQELLATRFPDVRRVRVRGMPNNRHFAKNQGIRLARGRFLLFLDDDSFAEPGWLVRILRMYDDPGVAGGGGRIIDEVFGRQVPGEIVGGLEANGRIHLNFTRATNGVVDVEHVIGCNMTFRAESLRGAGVFDLAYGGPNLMEETDLCLRVRRLGHRLRFDPDAVVYHANAPRDAGFKREMLDTRLEFWSARSRAYFALKLLPRTIAVLRHNALGALKQHAQLALRLRSAAHLRALLLQSVGLVMGSLDWVVWGCPRMLHKPADPTRP